MFQFFPVNFHVAPQSSQPECILWHTFNKTVVTRHRVHLEDRLLAPGTINVRLAAVRRLAYEAADTGLLSPDLAAGIRRVKGAKKLGMRLGNWLTVEEARTLWQLPNVHTVKGHEIPGKMNRSSSERKLLRVSVVGCGHVGLVTGGCLAAIGHHVVCADRDTERVHLLEGGILPVYEPHLAELIQRSHAAGLLMFTSDTGDAARSSDVIFLCVGVPQLDDSESDFAALDAAAKQIALAADSPKLVVERSTVPVQTGEQLKHVLGVYCMNRHASFQVAANPQFLREGTAVEDFLHPDHILLGVNDAESERTLCEIYAAILQQTFQCPLHPKTCPPRKPPKLVLTRVRSAELIKHASNAFLGVKISYANVLADLCERLGANIQEVTYAVGLDPRIGARFLQAGIGFGGDRLPKDLRAFCRLVEKAGVDAGILKAAEDINLRRIDAFFEKTQRSLWVLKDKQIGLLGLAHKADTDDIRGSPGIEFYKRLTAAGAHVCAYDPQAIPNARALFPHLVSCRDAYHAAEGADALVILAEWDEFRLLDWQRIHDLMARTLVLDGRNLLDPAHMKSLGFEYDSVGRPG